MVDDDEEEVEDLELPRAHRRSQQWPAIVLDSRVPALSGEVEREPRPPQRHDHRHDVETRIGEAGRCDEDPHVEHWHDGQLRSTHDVSPVMSDSTQAKVQAAIEMRTITIRSVTRVSIP